jgi:hypothetical protein
MKKSAEHWWNDTDGENPNYSESRPSATQIWHGLAWDRTMVSEVRGRRPTNWDVSRLLKPDVLSNIYIYSSYLTKNTPRLHQWIRFRDIIALYSETYKKEALEKMKNAETCCDVKTDGT